MRFKTFYLAVLVIGLAGCMSVKLQDESAKVGVQDVLSKQETNWNRGDLNGFMQGYWKSDSLEFVSPKGVTYGWEKTLQNYKTNYPDAVTMGHLTFTIMHVESINPTTSYVTGKWHLGRNIGDKEGFFTLLFRKIDNDWKIVSDHSS